MVMHFVTSTRANSSCVVGFSAAAMCLFVCQSVFTHDISKTDAVRITELDIDMFHDEFWKPINSGIKMLWSRSRGTN